MTKPTVVNLSSTSRAEVLSAPAVDGEQAGNGREFPNVPRRRIAGPLGELRASDHPLGALRGGQGGQGGGGRGAAWCFYAGRSYAGEGWGVR
eukprot:COSAG02_NODE_102_length_36716_cov_233.851025_7_plen_92_part_00